MFTFQVDAQRQVNGLVDNTFILSDFKYDADQINDGVNRIEWA